MRPIAIAPPASRTVAVMNPPAVEFYRWRIAPTAAALSPVTVVFRRWPLNVRSPEFQSSARAALRLQQIDAVAETGKQLDPAVRQGLGKRLLLCRGDRAVVAAEQQDRSGDARQ